MIPAALLALLLQAVPQKETLTIPGTKVSFDLVTLPGEGTLRPVAIGAKEVTWAEFRIYADGRALDAETRPSDSLSYLSEVMPTEAAGGGRPAVLMRWHAAAGYCAWLSKRTGRYFRLPTEREWEHAARAGERGAAPAALDAAAWHGGNSGKRTHAGGEKAANAFGLYDTLGNVWEYCLEFDRPPEFRPVLRGGSWAGPAAALGFSSRRTVPYEWFQDDPMRPRSVWWLAGDPAEQGFRVVCVPDAPDAKAREAAAAKISVQVNGGPEVQVRTGKASPDLFVHLKGQVTNGTGRDLDELQLRVSYVAPGGKPLLKDIDGIHPPRAIYTDCWPVLLSGANGAPLKAGGVRDFDVYVPLSFGGAGAAFGATVMQLRYAKE
jgi:hypothetical protein